MVLVDDTHTHTHDMEPGNGQAYWAEVRSIALDSLQMAIEGERPADEQLADAKRSWGGDA